MSKVYSLFDVIPIFLKSYDEKNKENEVEANSDWYLKKEELGRYGEEIVESFLKKKYGAIVKKQLDYIGFDFLVEINNRKFAVEVKTSNVDKNKFFISRNELEVAYKLQENYYIYRLYIEEDIKTLFIIQNPYEAFGIDNNVFSNCVVENEKVNIKIDGVEVNMTNDFMERLNAIKIE